MPAPKLDAVIASIADRVITIATRELIHVIAALP